MTQTIEQLQARISVLEEIHRQTVESGVAGFNAMQARVVELEAEIKRLAKLAYVGEHQFDACTWKHRHDELRVQLAAAQAYAEQLREALRGAVTLFACLCRDSTSNVWLDTAEQALAQPSDTSALDAYVADKVKEYQTARDYDYARITELTRQRDLAVDKSCRALEAWDSTVLPVANDGMMQERMETLRAAISTIKEIEVK